VRLCLVDGSGFIFRAYHAIQQPLTTSTGIPTKAVYGFVGMILKLLREERPDLLGVVFDHEGPSFRDQMYPAYKATRRAMPEDLGPQFPYVYRFVEAFGLPLVKVSGVEADDVIATLCRRAREDGMEVVIASGDKDLMQLVGQGVVMLDTMRDKRYGPADVEEKWGVSPEKLGDLLALMGDSSDNIPGVESIGPKTAADLLREHGSLEAVLAAAPRIKGKRGELLARDAELARLSRRLVTLRDDVDLELGPADLHPEPPDRDRLETLCRELEFTRLLSELGTAAPVERATVRTILDEAALDAVIDEVRAAGGLAVDIEATSPDTVRARLVGISLCWSEGQACYIPVGHTYLGAPRQLAERQVIDKLRPLFEDEALPKFGHDHKRHHLVLRRLGVDLRGVRCDPMIASFLLDASRSSHDLATLAKEHLGRTTIARKDVVGGGRKEVGFPEVDVSRAAEHAAEHADVTFRLSRLLGPRLVEEKLESLSRDVEIPLARVLAIVELSGIRIDVRELGALGERCSARMRELDDEVRALAGYDVNIASVPQLRELLFEKLGLPPGRRTKTGYSTDADVLEELQAEHPHPILDKILETREVTKLKNTYLDALPALVDPATGRVHTTYNQAGAATGRLSSSDPNLQNIPVRTDLGRQIRRAFVADPGHVLLSADYSQIELRVLAHLSEDPILLDAFSKGQDVHARTACEVFGVGPEAVTGEMRRVAKSVNFGLVFGQTDFGLARSLGIPRADARRYIESYFARYSRLRSFLDELVEAVKRGEPARTMLGRRRFVPDIHSPNRALRGYAERIARNTPIQGTAADILKLAMIRAQETIERTASRARMLLTVHDELVFEVPEADVEAFGARIREVMEGVLSLRVPLKVDLGWARTWAEAH
jgi:DNA polymerase I